MKAIEKTNERRRARSIDDFPDIHKVVQLINNELDIDTSYELSSILYHDTYELRLNYATLYHASYHDWESEHTLKDVMEHTVESIDELIASLRLMRKKAKKIIKSC
jgi:endonuclease III